MTCSDDMESDIVVDENSRSKRPALKRLSGNQLTDDSSESEADEAEEDEQPAMTAAAAVLSKELEKSPKRPRPDISRLSQEPPAPPDQCSTKTHSLEAADPDVQKEENKKVGDTTTTNDHPVQETAQETTNSTVSEGTVAPTQSAAQTDTATER